MQARTTTFSFIDNLTIEFEQVSNSVLNFALRSEDGKICCATEKKLKPGVSSVCWEGLNDLPYGIYTLECSQGESVVELKTVKRV
ncbi:MAG: hypothetical protein RLZZ172_1337 [Bacteroidota bacterium]|jgi:hypothetical protein